MMHDQTLSRRRFLTGAGALAGAAALGLSPERLRAAAKSPTSPVSIARCRTYELDQVLKNLDTMFDQLGGIKKLAAGKTVVVKVNLTGNPKQGALGRPASQTYQTHPNVALATAILLDRAGAKRIRFVDCTYQQGPIEELLRPAGWDLPRLASLKAAVDFEDTRNLGKGKQYTRVKVPWGGSLFPSYDLNHSYVECDTYLSVAKLKNHYTAGVTLSVKNNFGVTPTALYAGGEQEEHTTRARVAVLHTGLEKPPAGIPQELDPKSPRVTTYRVPRHTVDSIGIRPIDLAIIDGVETMSGGEGPWIQGIAYQKADVLLAGRNPVCTDAIATAVMGYDPLAARATGPFPGDNHLKLAMDLGLGTANPKEIEVLGLPLREALHPFNWEPSGRNY
ncbi:MAG TPA: DUF362 domain-containing protein [Armatimonadota bacterium]|nr:DUF362 domain-containing protein [Armatimonadota bacterium]